MYVVTLSFFLFNDTSTPEIYTYGHTLSLHDALPISAHHVGYHLISAGRPALEQALGFRLGRRRRLLRFMLQRPTAVYFALLARSEEHTSELQSLMRISYAVFCLKNKNKTKQ